MSLSRLAGSHPMIDSTEDGAVVTYLCEHVQAFTEPLSDLLRKYSGQRRRNVIVIPEGGVVTPAFDRLTAVAGALVLVQELGAGFRDLRSGRWFESVSAALRTDRDHQAIISKVFSRPSPTIPAVGVAASIYHPVRIGMSFGRVVELIIERLLPEATLFWGDCEPVGSAWDRPALTTFTRRHMPVAHLALVGHDSRGTLAGSMTVSPTRLGLEEYVEVYVYTATMSAEAQSEAARALLRALADETGPRLALVTCRRLRADVAVPVTSRTPPTPLGVLIGHDGTRKLRDDADRLAAAHHGETRGCGRRRCFLVSTDAEQKTDMDTDMDKEADWTGLLDMLRTLDKSRGNIARVLENASTDSALAAPDLP